MKLLKTVSIGALALVTSMMTLGCGPAGPKTYPVNGRVELTQGDGAVLAGTNIEVSLESDPTVRASGVIDENGRFTLETLHGGKIWKGAVEGSYQVRLILSDDDKEARRKAAQAISPKALKFESSGLKIQVPANGEVTLKVPKKL